MVLERLVTVREALTNPSWMFIVGGLVSTISLFIAFIIFPSSVGLMSTFLVTIAMTPFMVNLLRYEEKMTELQQDTGELLSVFQRHKKIIKVYIAFFAGMILSYSIIYTILPEQIVETLFEDQINEIKIIRGSFVGGTFTKIVLNNLGVLLVTYFFSFIFGAGAIFILSWNASVLSTAIGLSAKALGGFKALPIAILAYFPHGSLELLAYFIGGIAGGLASVAVSKGRPYTLSRIIKDSLIFLMWGVGLILIAGVVETISIVIS